jgi:hypothetical protein
MSDETNRGARDPVLLATVDLYDRGEDWSMASSWSRSVRPRMEVVEALVARGEGAVPALTMAMGVYALEMRKSTAVDIAVHPKSFSPADVKAVDRELHRRLAERWPNMCHAPAMALMLIGAPSVTPLLAVVRDEDWLARVEAIWALGGIRDQRALAPLRRIAAWWNVIEFPEVRRMARSAVQLITKEGVA